MADIIATYSIIPKDITSTGTGTITIEDFGFDKQAIANFTDVAKSINISYTGEPSMTASPDILAEEAIIELNRQLEPNYGPNYLSLQLVESSTDPESIPKKEEEEPIPIPSTFYGGVIRSSKPDGPRGQFDFEIIEEQIEDVAGDLGTDPSLFPSLYCTGFLYSDTFSSNTVNLEELGNPSQLELSTTDLSTDMDENALSNSVLEQMNTKLKELPGDFGTLSIVQTKKFPPPNFYNYEIIGKVIDSNSLEPLSNVLVEDNVNNKHKEIIGGVAYTNNTGEFILRGEYKKEEEFKLNFSLEEYQQKKNYSPFKKTDNGVLVLRKDIGIIELKSREVRKMEIINMTPLPDIQVKAIALNQKLKDPQGFFIDGFLNEMVKKLKTQLLPFLLQQLTVFGLASLSEALNDPQKAVQLAPCPANQEELKKAIEKLNKITKSLNDLFNSLNTIKEGISFLNQAITVADVVFQTLSAIILAFPSIPFAPDVMKAFTSKIPGFPSPPQNKSVQEFIAIVLAKAKIITLSTQLILEILLNLLQQVLSGMAILDQILQKCANEMGANDLLGAQEKITSDLLEATKEQALQGNPVITNINGFEMGVIPVEGTTNSQLLRRKAIARNKAGVIMLQGEPSFSSNDQILIDELIFYIKQNDLKAD